jgi:hypothetical protein
VGEPAGDVDVVVGPQPGLDGDAGQVPADHEQQRHRQQHGQPTDRPAQVEPVQQRERQHGHQRVDPAARLLHQQPPAGDLDHVAGLDVGHVQQVQQPAAEPHGQVLQAKRQQLFLHTRRRDADGQQRQRRHHRPHHAPATDVPGDRRQDHQR